MNSLDEQIDAVTNILRIRGRVAGIEPGAPDYLKRAFLDMILSNPDYRQAMTGKPDGTVN